MNAPTWRDSAQDNCTQDSNNYHLLAAFIWNDKVGHDHQEEKYVVNCQDLLDQISGEELQADSVGNHLPSSISEVQPQACVEDQCKHHPPDGSPYSLSKFDFMGTAMTHQN